MPFVRNPSRYSLQGFQMYYFQFSPHLMLSLSITRTVSSLVRYIANLSGNFLLISVCCMRSWKALLWRLKPVEVNTNKKIVQNETQYGVFSTYSGQGPTREGQQKGLIQVLRETTGLHSLFLMSYEVNQYLKVFSLENNFIE